MCEERCFLLVFIRRLVKFHFPAKHRIIVSLSTWDFRGYVRVKHGSEEYIIYPWHEQILVNCAPLQVYLKHLLIALKEPTLVLYYRKKRSAAIAIKVAFSDGSKCISSVVPFFFEMLAKTKRIHVSGLQYIYL